MQARAGQHVRVLWPSENGSRPLFTGTTVSGSPYVGTNRVRPDGQFIELPPAFQLELIEDAPTDLAAASADLDAQLERANAEGYDLPFVAAVERAADVLRRLAGRT